MEFVTDDGLSVPAISADRMREIDRIAVEETGPTLLQMMENAGRNLAGNARELRAGSGPVVVLAGAGGNGGGGLCAARHLLNHGVPVSVVLDRSPDEVSGAAGTQLSLLREMGVARSDESALADASLVIDALIGYGLDAAPRRGAGTLIRACEGRRVLSLDVPSGVNATTGETPGVSVSPLRTLTLALPKTGLADVPADLYLADIGIPQTVFERAGLAYDSPFSGDYWRRLRRA